MFLTTSPTTLWAAAAAAGPAQPPLLDVVLPVWSGLLLGGLHHGLPVPIAL